MSLRDIAASFGLSHLPTSPSIGNNLVDHIIAACSKLRESDGIVVLGNCCEGQRMITRETWVQSAKNQPCLGFIIRSIYRHHQIIQDCRERGIIWIMCQNVRRALTAFGRQRLTKPSDLPKRLNHYPQQVASILSSD